MLTGDKLETATNIAISSRLVSRMTPIYQFKPVKTRTEAHNELNNFRKHKSVIWLNNHYVIDSIDFIFHVTTWKMLVEFFMGKIVGLGRELNPGPLAP